MKFRLPFVQQGELADGERESNDAENTLPPGIESKTAALAVEPQLNRKEEIVTPEFQYGVQSAQAMTQVWSTNHLIAAYVL